MATIKKTAKKMQMGGGTKPMMKKGGSFPDLNKDGKVTQKDILIGKGVLPKTAKKGMKVKKAQNGDSTAYYNKFAKNMATKSKQAENKGDTATSNMYMDVMLKANQASQRQKLKGKPGYDKMGNPVKKQKMGGKTKKCAYGCK